MSELSFAVLLPSLNSPDAYTTLFSLSTQVFNDWVVFVPADGTDERTRRMICDQIGADRIRWLGQENARIEPEKGIFVLPLVPGDELLPDALAQFALLVSNSPEAHLLYGDHAEYYGSASDLTPFFKPGWSPEFLTANDYICRAAIRADRFAAHSLRSAYDALDLWAIWLKESRDPALKVQRVERVTMAIAPAKKSELNALADRGGAIIDEHLTHLGITGQAIWAAWARSLGVLAFDIEFPNEGPSVSILVPTRNNLAVLKRCVESLAKTTYRNFEIVIIDNASDDPATVSYLRGLDARIIRVASPPSGFSFSYVNNVAVQQTESDFLLFLNDDTEVIEPTWLSQLMGWAHFPGVASTGARLYFPDKLVQHSGLINNLLDGLLPAPAFKLTRRDAIEAHGQNCTVRNYAAVTAACMLTPRAVFEQNGGFDDEDFSVAYNDCDYGFRLTQQGLRHVCVPTAELFHYEGATRGRGRGNDKISEETAFIRRYQRWNDPYYNRNLSKESFIFEPLRRVAVEAGLPFEGLSVALFTHNLNYEGAPLVLLDVARGLKQMGVGHVLVVSLVEGPLREAFEAEGYQVVLRANVGVYGTRSEAELEDVLSPIADDLRSAGTDVVIANTILCHWGMEAARLAERPGIWIIHESEPPFSHLTPHGEHHVAVARRAFGEAYLNVFVAEATRALYQPLAKRANLAVLYNGFDHQGTAEKLAKVDRERERLALGAGSSDLVFLLPGTVCERKAQKDLVRALLELPDAVIKAARFVIVGDREGEYSRGLHQLAASLPASRRPCLTIIRETPDIWRYYAAADAMVFTSHLESFPRVIQEAMFCGLPIISTPVFGISEQLSDMKSGLLYPVGDVKALCRAIEKIVTNADLRKKLGETARISLDRFPTLVEMQDQYCTFVREAYLSSSKNETFCSTDVWLQDTSKNVPSWWHWAKNS